MRVLPHYPSVRGLFYMYLNSLRVLAALMLVLLSHAVFADEVRMKNGDHLTTL